MPSITDKYEQDVVSYGDVDYDALPSQGGNFPDPPQPGGPYSFQLPVNVGEFWQDFFATIDNKPTKRRRLAQSDKDKFIPVQIVGSTNGNFVGDTFKLFINSIERKRGKAGTPIPDTLYLALALSPTSKPRNSKEVEEIINTNGGGVFQGFISWEGRCNPDRDIYTMDGEEVSGQKGCGQRYAQRARKVKTTGEMVVQIPRDPDTGLWRNRFECFNESCKAAIRVFPNIDRFGNK